MELSAYICCSEIRSGKKVASAWFDFPISVPGIACSLFGEYDESYEGFYEYKIEEHEIYGCEEPFKITGNETIDYLNEIVKLYKDNEGNNATQYLGYLVAEKVFNDIKNAFEDIDTVVVHAKSIDDIAREYVIGLYGAESLALTFF